MLYVPQVYKADKMTLISDHKLQDNKVVPVRRLKNESSRRNGCLSITPLNSSAKPLNYVFFFATSRFDGTVMNS